uniref:nucleolar and spindle-associated protein 1 n=1 Tax=Monopterus albus TaxID=43700 RepID=UPI0009B40977|nr:nucleolar and spindle-associated protein 1 [Monopterus albus]
MDLDSMKYTEMRNLAKELGLKANMKADKLLKAIKDHYLKEKTKKDEVGQMQVKDAAVVIEGENSAHATCKKDVFSATVFVNTRRGKGKRKVTDAANVMERDAELPPSAAEGDTEVADSSAPSGARLAKKRKVSSAKDCDKTVPEPPDSHGGTEKAPKVVKAGKIPRYQGLQQANKQPVTPNFKKLHEAHFNKMESIDSYVQRKAKQMEMYRDSVKELKKANGNPPALFSPVPVNKRVTEDKRRHAPLSASKAPPNKPAGKEDAPFRPSVLSTRRINVRFSEATHDNEYKRSLVKTPARLSPCVTSSTPLKKPNIVKTLSTTKTPGPFVFTGNTSTSATPGTQKKPTFDLKASLSRPLAYKPHKGKLKPFGEMKENTMINNLTTNSHQKNYKQHQVQTRADRRARRMEDRKQKKESMLGARRGLVMS